MSVGYTLYTADFQTTIEHLQSDASDINNRTRGDSAEFSLYRPTNTLTIQTGETYTVASGTTEAYDAVDNNGTLVIESSAELIVYGSVDNDGTIDNDGTLTIDATKTLFDQLLQFDRHAGSYTLSGTLNNTQKFKERLPTNPNVSSLVVGLQPDTELQNDDIAGKWGLISNVTDTRTRALTNPVLALEIDILADYSEYADVTAVQNDLEI